MQVICSNVTERTFSLVAPGWIGRNGAGDRCEELGGKLRVCCTACRNVMTPVEAEIVSVQSWRGKR